MKSDTDKSNHYSIMTVDVEDGLSIAMRDLFNIVMPPTDRVTRNVSYLLDLFERNSIRATMFILGEVAVQFPGLIKTIANAGHEIGVHGFYHDQFFKISRDKAREDIYRAKTILEDLTGKPVNGFRAPAFSISHHTSWALEVVSELGFIYDSSIMPARTGSYGWPRFPRDINRLLLPGGNSIIEVPLSVISLLGKAIPACGGGYLRHLPYCYTQKAFRIIQGRRPVIVYLHPYEIDKEKYPDFFYEAMRSSTLRRQFKLSFYRLNKSGASMKLEKLIKEFSYKPAIEVINYMDSLNRLNIVKI